LGTAIVIASENLATPLHSYLPVHPSSLHSSPEYGAEGSRCKIRRLYNPQHCNPKSFTPFCALHVRSQSICPFHGQNHIYMVTRNIKTAHFMDTLRLAIWDNRNCCWWYKRWVMNPIKLA